MSAPFVTLDWPPHVADAPGFACPPSRSRITHGERKGWLRVTYTSRDELRACLDATQMAWHVQRIAARKSA